MISLALVAFAFGALFSIYSSAFPLLRNQQDTITATLCLQERLDNIRFLSWPALTDATRIQLEILSKPAASGANLTGLVEEITISSYPDAPGAPTPIHVRRRANGKVKILSAGSLSASAMVRVDLLNTWQQGRRTRTREISAVVAYGGIVR